MYLKWDSNTFTISISTPITLYVAVGGGGE
jgi:hypothetical protein